MIGSECSVVFGPRYFSVSQFVVIHYDIHVDKNHMRTRLVFICFVNLGSVDLGTF